MYGYSSNDSINRIDPSGLRSGVNVRAGAGSGSAMDQFAARTDIGINQARKNNSQAAMVGAGALCAGAAAAAAPAATAACMANPALCSGVAGGLATGFMEGITGEQTGFPPSDIVDAISGWIGRNVGEFWRQ